MPEEQVTDLVEETPAVEETPIVEETLAVEAEVSGDAEEAPAEAEAEAEAEAAAVEGTSAEETPAKETPAEQVVEVATFTAEELAAAVQDEIVKATSRLQEEKAAMQAQIDALEIAAANEKARADEAASAFEAYKTAQAAEVEQVSLRDARVAAAQAANPNLAADFFTEERANAYTEMTEEQFNLHVVSALRDAFAASPHAFVATDDVACDTCVCGKDESAHTARDEKAFDFSRAPKTSAFTGGTTPTGHDSDTSATPTQRLLSAKRAKATTAPVA